jgi:hypothetical protein
MVFAKVRGPIGGPREDHYLARLAMAAGGPYSEEQAKALTLTDFYPYWTPREWITPVDDGDDDEDGDTGDDED